MPIMFPIQITLPPTNLAHLHHPLKAKQKCLATDAEGFSLRLKPMFHRHG